MLIFFIEDYGILLFLLERKVLLKIVITIDTIQEIRRILLYQIFTIGSDGSLPPNLG